MAVDKLLAVDTPETVDASEAVGKSGAAELLRDAASNVNMNVDKVVPNGGQMTILEQKDKQISQLYDDHDLDFLMMQAKHHSTIKEKVREYS